MNNALKYLYHKFIDRSNRWYPLLGIYYLTYQCNFRCPYCSNGEGIPYHEQKSDPPVSVQHSLSVLKKIRSYTDHLLMTGGEPLEHPDFESVLQGIGELGFKTLTLNTNGYHLDQYMEAISQRVSTLVISLDSLNEKKADAWSGLGHGTLRQILKNIETACSHINKLDIILSAVITPANIDDIYEIYRYASERKIQIAVSPELQGTTPNPKLLNNAAYQKLFDYLIAEKKKGGRIFGSSLYLQHMQKFMAFHCHPFALLVITPSGNILFPCLEIGQVAGNILEEISLHKLRTKAKQKHPVPPRCEKYCHSACALGFSLAIKHPWADIQAQIHSKARHW